MTLTMLKTETATRCLCGEQHALQIGTKDDVPIVRCSECGIVRVGELDEQTYAAQYASGFYHDEHIATVVEKTIKERFDHDFAIAKLRMIRMLLFCGVELEDIRNQKSLLDVGCANGAFVQHAADVGFRAAGLDLSDGGFPDNPDLCSQLQVADLNNCGFGRRTMDFITMHDVIEHAVDPRKLLREAAGVLRRDGFLVIETPDFGQPFETQGLDFHHVKPKEHIWMLNPVEWNRIFLECGLVPFAFDTPVDGKITFYLRVDPKLEMDVKVFGPTGIGDIHWVLLKLQGLKVLEAPCKLTLITPGIGDQRLLFRGGEYLKLVPFLDDIEFHIARPVIADAGTEDVSRPVYRLIANGHLEMGSRIEDWHPEWTTDFHYPVQISEDAEAWAAELLVTGPLVVIYMSSEVWNMTITNNKLWSVDDWIELIIRLNRRGISPVIVGKDWDLEHSQQLKGHGLEYRNMVGKTSVEQCIAMFRKSDAVLGLCSGITILAVHENSRAVVFWPEKGLTESRLDMHKNFQTNWVDPAAIEGGRYCPLSLGAFDIETVDAILADWGLL